MVINFFFTASKKILLIVPILLKAAGAISNGFLEALVAIGTGLQKSLRLA
jgi:hypothetical protein